MEYKTMKTLKRRFAILVVMILSFAMLGACGVKPESVEPPAGVQHDTFPNTYPDVSTDPAP